MLDGSGPCPAPPEGCEHPLMDRTQPPPRQAEKACHGEGCDSGRRYVLLAQPKGMQSQFGGMQGMQG